MSVRSFPGMCLSMESVFVDTWTLRPENYQKSEEQLLAAISAVKSGRSIRELGRAYKITVYVLASHESRHHRRCSAWSQSKI
jgi:hypothetical protein